MRRKQICVIGNYDANDHQFEKGESIGKLLAELDLIAITGGRGGLMEAVAKGCSENGGTSIGILPGEDMNDGNEYNTIVIPTGIGYARNSVNVLASDAVIAVGGAAGTLSELAYSWSYNKPIAAMVGSGGWSDKLAGLPIDHRKNEKVHPINNLDELKQWLLDL